jgi:hypothetical protein
MSTSTRVNIDAAYAEVLRRHVNHPEIMKDLGCFTRRMFMSKHLGHYDLYKQVATLPGDVVELGVYKGESLLNFAKFMEMLNPGDRAKRVIGFDHWQGLGNYTEKDGPRYETVGNVEGGWNPAEFYDTLVELIDLFHKDSFIPQKPRIELVNGDIRETVFDYVEQHPGLRISLLHFDCDLYEPTLAGLKALYPHVVTGGIVLFDEYGIREWGGESNAVDDFFGGKPPRMQKFPWLSTPGAWFVKD